MTSTPPLRRLHSDALLESRRYAASVTYWRAQSTRIIVDSLSPTAQEPLVVRTDGLVLQGNTRIKVLEERGFDVNSLPRTVIT